MERSDIHRCLAEEADTDLIAAAVLDRPADACGERYVPADNTMTTEKIQALVEEMHRAALSTRAAVLSPKQLSHHRARAHSARERLTMVTIGSDDVVVGAKHGHRPCGDRFLTDVEVAEAADLPKCIRLGAALLESSLDHHRPQEILPEARLIVRGLSVVAGCRRSLSLRVGRNLRCHTPAAWTCSHAW